MEPYIIINDAKEQARLIEFHHIDPILGGHVGSKRLYSKLKSKYQWKNMAKQVARYTRKCHQCQTNKSKQKTIEPLSLANTPQKCFDKIVIDTLGPLPKSDSGNAYLVTIMCDLSKYLICVPTRSKDADTIARAIFDNVILIYGPVHHILTDCGTEYKNQILRELCKLLNIKQAFSTPYHHQTVGTVERNHRVLNEYFRAYLKNQQSWEEYIKYYTFCFNTTPHTSFGFRYSPFELVFGKKPEIFEVQNQSIPYTM